MDAMKLSDAIDASLPSRIRLTFVVLLLLHQVHSLVVEMCYIYKQKSPLFAKQGVIRAVMEWLEWHFEHPDNPMDPPPTWTWAPYTKWVLINGLSMCFIGIIFSIFTFLNAGNFQRRLNTQCDARVDGDIAGAGVRTAIWIQIALVIFVVMVNVSAVRSPKAAVKELAGGLLITHLSLAISLVVLRQQGRLSALNAGVGAMILDAQNVALSVSFSSKDVLAARWAVLTIAVSQLAGMICIGVVMGQYRVGNYQTDDCHCFAFFWWAWHDTCQGVPWVESSIFWVYYDFRWLNTIHNWLFGLRYMWDFHDWEMRLLGKLEDDDDNDDDDDLHSLVPQITRPDNADSRPFWEEVPDTVGTSLFRHSVFGLASMTAAELTLLAHDVGRGPEEFTVGQVTGVIIAGITIMRATWLFLMAFYKD